jgi:hypothetical protein
MQQWPLVSCVIHQHKCSLPSTLTTAIHELLDVSYYTVYKFIIVKTKICTNHSFSQFEGQKQNVTSTNTLLNLLTKTSHTARAAHGN